MDGLTGTYVLGVNSPWYITITYVHVSNKSTLDL